MTATLATEGGRLRPDAFGPIVQRSPSAGPDHLTAGAGILIRLLPDPQGGANARP